MFSVSILEIVRYVLTGVLLSFCALYFWFHLKFSHWSRKGVPGPLPAFPAGNIAGVFLRRKQFFQPFIESYAKYKHLPFVGMYTLYNPVLLVNDLKLAKSVLVKDFTHFEAHGTTACEKMDPLSVHIFNLHGEKWRKLRHMFSPVFTTGKIKTMVSHLHAAARDFRAHIDANLHSGVPEDLSLAFSKFSIDVIGRVAFGLECDSFKDPNSAYVRNGYEFFAPSTVYWRIIRTLWFLTPELFRKLNTPRIKPETTEFFLSLVRQTAAMREREGLKRNDFLQILLELKNNELQDENGERIDGDEGMSWTQMAAHSMVFLAAGFESTSTTAAFTIYELAQNEDILDMTRKEMFTVLEKHGGRPTYDALAEMTYLSLVIEETLRKHPPMRALFRRCTKNYHIPGTKVVIEKGTWAFVPIQGFHNDPDIFPEPEKFRPERFLSENRTETQMAAYMPFGDGPKMCLGVRFGMMAVKMALVSFLSRYDFKLSERSPVPMKYSTTALSLVADPGVYVDLRPLKGYDLKVEF